MIKSTQQTFKQAFEILKTNSQKLDDQTEPDIDHLMKIVEQSTAAYKVCKARIDAVEKALAQTFGPDSDN
jgi:exodeoxyribonuclease VII small subunit